VAGMAAMEENSVDAIVTDPPYGLEFMGEEWDKLEPNRGRHAGTERKLMNRASVLGGNTILPNFASQKRNYRCAKCGKYRWSGESSKCHCDTPDFRLRHMDNEQQAWHHRWAVEAYRVLKPGGYLVAFGGTRTSHRLVCALEDAGFEIRDTICWLYGSGFPKSLDVSKAIDKAAGAEREVVRTIPDRWAGKGTVLQRATQATRDTATITAPATPDAARWQGWGTALKPGHEPVCVARKPLSERNVSANVLRWGTGGLNVDGCRVGTSKRIPGSESSTGPTGYQGGWGLPPEDRTGQNPNIGRWPANVCLSHSEECAESGGCAPHCPVRMLDEQSGERSSHHSAAGIEASGLQGYEGGFGPTWHPGYGADTGGASRFFYCAKASRAERNAGLEGLPERHESRIGDGIGGAPSIGGKRQVPERKNHPTVKPLSLMRWLVRLVCPPGGTVLDPFTGSGTTGMACAFEGFGFVGFEQDAGYAEIARLRIAWAEAEVARAPSRLQEGEAQELAAGLSQGSVFGGQERP